MDFIPENLRPQLLANGSDPDHDHVPLVALFVADGPGGWLISEIQPYDHDVVFGLMDYGFAVPQIGAFTLSELHKLNDLGVKIARDLLFVGRYPLSVYGEAARLQRAITTIPSLLDAAAARLAARRDPNSGPDRAG